MKEYLIFSDGGARGNPGPAAAAFLVFRISGQVICRQNKFLGETTNNVAEYQAVVMALDWLVKNINEEKQTKFSFYLDSQLVVNQLMGRFKIKDEKMKKMVMKVKELEKKVTGRIEYLYVPREYNRMADYLVNQKIDES